MSPKLTSRIATCGLVVGLAAGLAALTEPTFAEVSATDLENQISGARDRLVELERARANESALPSGPWVVGQVKLAHCVQVSAADGMDCTDRNNIVVAMPDGFVV